jgi:hypothetical protein
MTINDRRNLQVTTNAVPKHSRGQPLLWGSEHPTSTIDFSKIARLVFTG